jgi:hypothetical protein
MPLFPIDFEQTEKDAKPSGQRKVQQEIATSSDAAATLTLRNTASNVL